MRSAQFYLPTFHEYDTYPRVPICHDFSSNNGPERPLLEEEDEEDPKGRFRNASALRHTSPPSPSPEPPSTVLSSSPAAMFLSSFMSPQQLPKPDGEGQIISGYTLGDIIGYGSSSIIRKACSASGDVVAVKIVRRADLVKAGNALQARKRLQHEASVWSTLSHEHIIPLFSAVHTSHADYFFTLFCPAGSLFDILKRDGRPALPQDDTGMMFRQVVRGLRYLHEVSQLVHRDMKLENVLVDEMGMCRIGDFGMSRKIGLEDSEDEDYPTGAQHDQLPDMLSSGNSSVHRAVSLTAPSLKRQLGTLQANHLANRHNIARHRNSTSSNQPTQSLQPGSLPYAAPELLLPQTSDVLRPHPGQDMWALGVMLYTLLTGRLPFADSFEPRLQMKILSGDYAVPEGIGRGAERILQGCLERDIPNRWNIAMVDDLAWGVGWGAEGDDATPTNPDDEAELQHKPPTPHSRSRSRPPDLELSTTIDWEEEEPRPRSTFEAAARRSSSRANRTLSRAPIPSSSSGRASRSASRRSRVPSPILLDYMTPSPGSFSPASSTSPRYQVPFSDPSSPAFSPERGRRPNKVRRITSRSPSPSVVPSTPKDDARVSLITGVLEHPDELHLDPSTRERSTVRTPPDSSDEPHAKRVQPTVGFEREIADWTAHTQDMEHIEGDNEEHAMPKSKMTITIGSDRHQQKLRSLPPPSLRWTQANNNNSYVEHRPTPAERFLNLGSAISPSNLPRSRSAEYNRYLD